MEEIRKEEIEAFHILKDANVDEECLLSFTRSDLKDLFDGSENFMLRRRLWSIIEKSKEGNDNLDVSMIPKSIAPQSNHGQQGTLSQKLPPIHSTPSINSSYSPQSSRSESPNPVCIELPDDTDIIKPQPSPAFVVYSDSEISYASKNNSLSPDLLNRLVRNTISNMRSACQRLPIRRETTGLELEDMARALCKRFPCLEKRSEDGKSFLSLSTEERLKLTGDQRNELIDFDETL